MEPNAARVKEALDELDIACSWHEHPPVHTVEEAEEYWGKIAGAHCKNLFLRNKKGNNHYLLIARSSRKIDLKNLTARIAEDRLSFASEARLRSHLVLTAGAVSPFGLINDMDRRVIVLIDRDLKDEERVNFHPNVNTATVGISYEDFERFLKWCGNEVQFIEL